MWVLLAGLLLSGVAHAQSTGYLNLTRDDAVRVAITGNRDITNAREDFRRAGLQVSEAAAEAFPQLNGFWNTERVLKPMVFVIEFPNPETGKVEKNRLKVGTDHTMNLGMSLTQTIWKGGKVGAALDAAKIYRYASEKTLNATTQNVIAGVVQAFNGVLLSEEMLGITRDSLAQAERNLERVQSLYSAGRATEYDLLRARVNVANMKPPLLNAEKQVAVSRLTLKNVLGVDPEEQISVTGTLDPPDTTLFAIATPEYAFRNRPDLDASESSVDLYKANVKIARGNFLPELSAGSTFQYMGNFDAFTYNPDDWNPYWTATVNLSFPIFSGFRNSSQYKQAKVQFRKASTDYRKMRDMVVIEVQEGVLEMRRAVQAIDSQKLNVQEAEKALEMAESMYAGGKATQLQVLDAQLALEQAKINMATALHDGLAAEINLKKSLGIIHTDL